MIAGLHAYHVSIGISNNDYPFYALIMAAMRKADTENLGALSRAFPAISAELQRRYNAPLGVIAEDGNVDLETLAKQVKRLHK